MNPNEYYAIQKMDELHRSEHLQKKRYRRHTDALQKRADKNKGLPSRLFGLLFKRRHEESARPETLSGQTS